MILHVFENIYRNANKALFTQNFEKIIDLYKHLIKNEKDVEQRGRLLSVVQVYLSSILDKQLITQNTYNGYNHDLSSINFRYENKFSEIDDQLEEFRSRIHNLEVSQHNVEIQTDKLVDGFNMVNKKIEQNVLSQIRDLEDKFASLYGDVTHIEKAMNIRHKKIQIQNCVTTLVGFLPVVPAVLNTGIELFFTFACDPESKSHSKKKKNFFE